MSRLALFHGIPEPLERTASFATPLTLGLAALFPALPLWLRVASGTLAVLQGIKLSEKV